MITSAELATLRETMREKGEILQQAKTAYDIAMREYREARYELYSAPPPAVTQAPTEEEVKDG